MNKASLLTLAESVLLLAPAAVPQTFYVPPFYKDAAASRAAKAPLATDSYNFSVLVRAYLYTSDDRFLAAASAIVTRWTTGCAAVTSKDDTPLVVCYLCYSFLEGARLLATKTSSLNAAESMAHSLDAWCSAVLWPSVLSIAGNFNNWQSWSIFMQANRWAMQKACWLSTSDTTKLQAQLRSHLAASTRPWPIVGRKGEFWTENIRVNNALTYTAFSLTPLMLAARLLGMPMTDGDEIAALAANCRDPAAYYKRFGYPGSLVGWVMHWFVSSDAVGNPPDPTGWTGELFYWVRQTLGGSAYPDLVKGPPFAVGVGGYLLYFVENDAELSLL